MDESHLKRALTMEDTDWCTPFDAAVVGENRRNADLLRGKNGEYSRAILDENIARVQQDILDEKAQHERQLKSLQTNGSNLLGKGIFWPMMTESTSGYGFEPYEVLRYGKVCGWGLQLGDSLQTL